MYRHMNTHCIVYSKQMAVLYAVCVRVVDMCQVLYKAVLYAVCVRVVDMCPVLYKAVVNASQ